MALPTASSVTTETKRDHHQNQAIFDYNIPILLRTFYVALEHIAISDDVPVFINAINHVVTTATSIPKCAPMTTKKKSAHRFPFFLFVEFREVGKENGIEREPVVLLPTTREKEGRGERCERRQAKVLFWLLLGKERRWRQYANELTSSMLFIEQAAPPTLRLPH